MLDWLWKGISHPEAHVMVMSSELAMTVEHNLADMKVGMDALNQDLLEPSIPCTEIIFKKIQHARDHCNHFQINELAAAGELLQDLRLWFLRGGDNDVLCRVDDDDDSSTVLDETFDSLTYSLEDLYEDMLLSRREEV